MPCQPRYDEKSDFFFERFQMNLFIKLALALTVEDIFGWLIIPYYFGSIGEKKNNIRI